MRRSPTTHPAGLFSQLALGVLTCAAGCSAELAPLPEVSDSSPVGADIVVITDDVATGPGDIGSPDGESQTPDAEPQADSDAARSTDGTLDAVPPDVDLVSASDADSEPVHDVEGSVVDAQPADAATEVTLPDIVEVPDQSSTGEEADAGADIVDVSPPAEEVGPTEPMDVVEPPPEPVDYEGTCCGSNGSPGCNQASCVALVCEEDPYCCEFSWDKLCASCAGGEQGCAGVQGVCGCDVDEAGPCCESHTGGLCYSLPCTIAVCSLDPYCCDNTWDDYCVGCAEGGMTYSDVSCAGVEETCGCEPPVSEPTHLDLAKAWAPVWYHDTDDSAYEADYITAYDFDGDTISSNNWENLYAPQSDLRAVIYWSIVETTTHWYILYTDFHPRDWTEDCDPLLPFLEPCHENDMEGAMVMVEKDASTWGSFVLLVTEAHNILHIFRNDPAITALSTEHLESPAVTFEDERHPELYVESKGHGVCALGFDGSDHCEHPLGANPFPGGDGIVYRYKGQAEEPTSGNDWDVGYDLVSFEDTIWQQRQDICDGSCTFDQTFEYQGTTLAKAFDGDSWGDDKANPPWAWDDPDDGPVYRGDFFFRPAHAVTTWLDIPGAVSTTYIFNPYLDAL